MRISNTGVNRARGSALAITIIGLMFVAVLLGGSLTLLNTQALHVRLRQNALGRIRTQASARNVLVEAVLTGVQGGGLFSAVTTEANAALANTGDPVWSADFTAITVPLITLGDRAAIFGPTDGALSQASSLVARARTSYFIGSLGLTGTPGLTGSVAVTPTVTAALVEIPATEFQFIVSDQTFQQSLLTNVFITGKALFNQGIAPLTPQGLTFNSNPGTIAFYFGSAHIPSPGTAGYPYTPTGNPYGFTRAIGGMGNLIVSPGNSGVSAMVSNQALSLSPISTDLEWTDANVAPLNLPPGVSLQPVLGVNRLVVDLSAYYGTQNIHVDCSAATQSNGIVVLGCPASNSLSASPVCVTTTGAMMLLGTNARPAITGTSYSLALGADTASPTTAASANVTWAGYVCLTQANAVITSPCSWGSYAFVILGTFAFPGGTLNNAAVPIAIAPSPSTALALCSGNVLPDRLFFVENR